jgi:heme-degrading monooxygenase HmoA
MFSVLFEVCPKPEQWDAYLGKAKMLRPELEQIEGFVDNVRYKSLTREGWILSLSSWRDEKAVVRWRTQARHHEVQQEGRDAILLDYHLRVGQYVQDTQLPEGQELKEKRLDETEVGEGTTVTLITARRSAELSEISTAQACAQYLGLDLFSSADLAAWDVYEAVLTPGDLILMLVWRDRTALHRFKRNEVQLPSATHRIRHVRVIRDYGMFDRREAPQYYPAAKAQ